MSDEVYDEIVAEFYGINPVSLKVDNVAITRTGTISHWTVKRGFVRYSMTGPDLREEITRLLGWKELIEVPPRTPNDQRRKILMDLQAQALTMCGDPVAGESSRILPEDE